MMNRSLLVSLVILSCSLAEARVFNFSGVSVSSYLRSSGGTSHFANDAFNNSGGSGAVYGDGVQYQFGAEIGFAFEMSAVTARVGFEFFRPQHLSNYDVKNTSGTVVYDLDSDIIGYSPALTLEFPLSKAQTSKSYFFAGGGYSTVTLKNMYTFTSAGTSAYGRANFTEDTVTNTIYGMGGVGYETLMVDNITFGIEVGYRYMQARNFSLKAPANSFVGNKQTGDFLTNYESGRVIDMSHPFLAILFKFYI